MALDFKVQLTKPTRQQQASEPQNLPWFRVNHGPSAPSAAAAAPAAAAETTSTLVTPEPSFVPQSLPKFDLPQPRCGVGFRKRARPGRARVRPLKINISPVIRLNVEINHTCATSAPPAPPPPMPAAAAAPPPQLASGWRGQLQQLMRTASPWLGGALKALIFVLQHFTIGISLKL